MIRGTVIDVFYEDDDGGDPEVEKGLCIVIRPDNPVTHEVLDDLIERVVTIKRAI